MNDKAQKRVCMKSDLGWNNNLDIPHVQRPTTHRVYLFLFSRQVVFCALSSRGLPPQIAVIGLWCALR